MRFPALSIALLAASALILTRPSEAAALRIDAISPAEATPGSEVTIFGDGFGASAGAVALSGLRIEPSLWSPGRVRFVLPLAGVSGPLVVSTRHGDRSEPARLTVSRSLPAGQYAPEGLDLVDTGLLGAATLVATDGECLYGVVGFETLVTHLMTDEGPYRLLSMVHLPQRVGDIRVTGGHLYCAGDHGLRVYRCSDLQVGLTEPVASVFDGACLAVDARTVAFEDAERVVVALCEYRPRDGSDALRVPLYAFEDEELVPLGSYSRRVEPAERQHAIVIDPLRPKVYVSGYRTLLGSDRYILEVDIADPSRPRLSHREETGGILAFDMDACRDRLWAGVSGTGTEHFRVYRLHAGDTPLELERVVAGRFGAGRTTRVQIIDERSTVGVAWAGARPDVFVMDTFVAADAPFGKESPLASTDTIDWAFDVAGFPRGGTRGGIVVADEWGGFLTYEYRRTPDAAIEHAPDHRAVVAAAMTEGLHVAADRVYVAGRGAGAWSADRDDLSDPDGWRSVRWEWGEETPQPHPVSGLATREDPEHGTLIAALGHEKAMAWGQEIRGLLYRETDRDIELLAGSEAIEPPGLFSSGVDVVWAEPDLVYMTTGTDGLRAFVVDPDGPDISLHESCREVGFATDVFSTSNMAVTMAHLRRGSRRTIVVGSRPALLVGEPTVHVFDIDYPEGVPDRTAPRRRIIVRREVALECSRWKPVQHLDLLPSGRLAVATDQGLALLRLEHVDNLNELGHHDAWGRVNVPASAFEPWWDGAWAVAVDDVSFSDDNTLWVVKSPVGVWRIECEAVPGTLTHRASATAHYPGVQCGMDYTQLLGGWGDPDVVPLHHPYAVAADGASVFVTGWSGKVQRLADLGAVCGDGNRDGRVDVSDAIALLAHLFLGEPLAAPLAIADVNADGGVDISDPVALLMHLFVDGRPVCQHATSRR